MKIILNLFKAVKDTFKDQWENALEYNLSKTTGYSGIIKALPELYKYGYQNKKLTYEYFKSIFSEQ